MKKSGFTLAPGWVTSAVIGVVTALTMPALVGGYQKSKVGPSLRKFINTMEVANEHILVENEANTITSAVSDTDEYLDVLGDFVQGSSDGDTMSEITLTPKSYSSSSDGAPEAMSSKKVFNMASGEAFGIQLETNSAVIANAKDRAKGSYKGEIGYIYYDLNGFETKPNRLGRDIFYFILDNSGKLIPYGGLLQSRAYSAGEDEEDSSSDSSSVEQEWKNGTDKCTADTVTSGATCSASVMDNNWKVVYKY